MAGVFLSYSRADHLLAQQIIDAFRRIEVEVWWDVDMPGVDWQDELARELNAMAAVAVVWTPNSVASKNVKDEARLGLRHEKLINVMAGIASPPFPFDRVNGLPIDGWDGVSPHGGWTRVVQTIESLAVEAGSVRHGEIVARLAESEKALLGRRAAAEAAEQEFHDAQAGDAAATEAEAEALAKLKRAERDLDSVRATSVGPAILRAAQQEYDAAETAARAAAGATRQARTRLSAASRTLTQAKAALAKSTSAAAAPSPLPKRTPRSPDPPASEDAEARPEATSAASASNSSADATPVVETPAAEATTPHRGGFRSPALLAGGGLVAALLVVAVMALLPSAKPSNAQIGPNAPAGNAMTTAPPTPTANATASPPAADPATALIGRWDLGFGCANNAVTFSEAGGVVVRLFAGTSVAVHPAPGAAHGTFRADDGALYRLSSGALSMIPAGETAWAPMARCAT